MSVINNKTYDWASVNLKFPDFELVVQEISYDDELEKEIAYGYGQMPRGWGEGNYKAEGKLSLLKDDFNDLLDYCNSKGIGIYRLMIPKVVVSYAHEDQPTRTDVLSLVTFTKTGSKAAQGDKNLKIDLDILIVGGIERDGVKAI